MINVDVLAIFAHPDDLELAVGGTLFKLKSLGYKTGALDITRGEMGTRGTKEIRANEAHEAAKILKLDARENLGLPDGHVFVTHETRTELVRILRNAKPKVILTHQSEDSHPDHHNIAQLVRESARLASLTKYDEAFGQERITAPIVAHSIFSRRILPSFIVDVSEFAEGKMKAIAAHKSQFHDPNSKEPETILTGKNFLGDIEGRMRYYGSLIGTEAGEPFFVREALNVDDPIALLTRTMNLYS